MAEETRRFFGEFLTGDHDLTEMLDADFTYVNGPLASLYGIPGVTGDAFQRVSVGGSPRGGGLLSQGSILTVTSTPVRASIPKRGRFILSQLLCQQAKDPPPGVPQIPATPSPGQTTRQQLEAVTAANGVCLSCHSLLNPLGGGLGHFDGIGAWQELENGQPIDATGKLPDGTTFDGAQAEAKALAANPSLPACVARQTLTYALGRDLTQPQDGAIVSQVAASAAQNGNRLKALIQAVTASEAFTARRGGTP
jgi:hypothetical protein